MAEPTIDLDQLLFDDEPMPASVSRFPQSHRSPAKRRSDHIYAQQLQSAYDDLLKRHAIAESTIEHLKLHQGIQTPAQGPSGIPVAFDAESESAHAAARRAELERKRAMADQQHLEQEVIALRRQLREAGKRLDGASESEARREAELERVNQERKALAARMADIAQENEELSARFEAMSAQLQRTDSEKKAIIEQQQQALRDLEQQQQQLKQQADSLMQSQQQQPQPASSITATIASSKPFPTNGTTNLARLGNSYADTVLDGHQSMAFPISPESSGGRRTGVATNQYDTYRSSTGADRSSPTSSDIAQRSYRDDVVVVRFELSQVMQQLHDVVSQAFMLRQSYDRLADLSTSPHAQQPEDIAQDLQRLAQEHDDTRQRYEDLSIEHRKLIQQLPSGYQLPAEWQHPPTFPLLRNSLDASVRLAGMSASRHQSSARTDKYSHSQGQTYSGPGQSRQETRFSNQTTPRAGSYLNVDADRQSPIDEQHSHHGYTSHRQSADADVHRAPGLGNSILKASRTDSRGTEAVNALERSVRFARDDTVYNISPAGMPGFTSTLASDEKRPRAVPSRAPYHLIQESSVTPLSRRVASQAGRASTMDQEYLESSIDYGLRHDHVHFPVYNGLSSSQLNTSRELRHLDNLPTSQQAKNSQLSRSVGRTNTSDPDRSLNGLSRSQLSASMLSTLDDSHLSVHEVSIAQDGHLEAVSHRDRLDALAEVYGPAVVRPLRNVHSRQPTPRRPTGRANGASNGVYHDALPPSLDWRQDATDDVALPSVNDSINSDFRPLPDPSSSDFRSPARPAASPAPSQPLSSTPRRPQRRSNRLGPGLRSLNTSPNTTNNALETSLRQLREACDELHQEVAQSMQGRGGRPPLKPQGGGEPASVKDSTPDVADTPLDSSQTQAAIDVSIQRARPVASSTPLPAVNGNADKDRKATAMHGRTATSTRQAYRSSRPASRNLRPLLDQVDQALDEARGLETKSHLLNDSVKSHNSSLAYHDEAVSDS
eukprot:TRINITY_DN12417_c1_g1_i1.p2 TRINITY_DN12417_c1_g1~~TRINITY_DN12417_c1_g1_i1.p2  ORF type:complete len:1002 (+),score=191.83 TRINITY_DN12417_c1_g1_i1:3885-6890(+)